MSKIVKYHMEPKPDKGIYGWQAFFIVIGVLGVIIAMIISIVSIFF